MQFDQLNGVLSVHPKSYAVEGEHILYGRVSYFLPYNAFTKIVGSDFESKKLFASLVGLGYLDTNGFVTSSFDGDLSLLDDRY